MEEAGEEEAAEEAAERLRREMYCCMDSPFCLLRGPFCRQYCRNNSFASCVVIGNTCLLIASMRTWTPGFTDDVTGGVLVPP